MVQQLILKGQFAKILENYRPNADVVMTLQRTPIALFDGPSASGRNTIMHNLLKTDRYLQILSDTTRKPRINNGVQESNGVEYWFKSEEEFLKDLQRGAYIEAAIIHDQQVSGTSVKEIQRAENTNRIAINDVQPDGVDAFKALKPDTICIFVIPPTFNTWIERINIRGTMNGDELVRRLQSAQTEIDHALKASYYHYIVNDDLGQAVQLADEICNGTAVDTSDARSTAQELLVSIDEYLKTI